MSRILFAISVVLCAAICSTAGDSLPQLKQLKPVNSNKVPGLELTGPQTAAPGQRVAVIVAVCDGSVKWEVKGGTSSAEVGDGKNLLVFFAGSPETIEVKAYTAIGGNPTDKATTTITVGGVPVMPNPPAFAPGKAQYRIHASFVLPSPVPPAFSKLDSPDLKKTLDTLGVQLHKHDSVSIIKASKDPEVAKKINAVGGLPAVILQDDEGNLIPGGIVHVRSIAEALKAIDGALK